MTYTKYELIKVAVAGRVATVTLDNPPINLITQELFAELRDLVGALKNDPDLTVVVFKSADPDFFLAHFDVSSILEFPIEGDAERATELSAYHLMCERLRTMDKVTIAQRKVELAVVAASWFLVWICALALRIKPSSIRWRYHWVFYQAVPARKGCRVWWAAPVLWKSFWVVMI